MSGIDDRQPLNPPFVIALDKADEADPGAAPPVGETAVAAPVSAGAALGPQRGLGAVAAGLLGALLVLIISAALWSFVERMMAQNSALGWIALTLSTLAALVLLVLAGQEALAYWRQVRIDGLRLAAEAAHDLAAARTAAAGIARLYAGRADMVWALARLQERQEGVLDADALLSLTETELMAPLDRAALAKVETASRQVALVTALVPLALADVAVTLFANLRMIRQLSAIYGGRSGRMGSLRLLRRVAGTVLGAGALALGDDMIGSLAGGGVLGKLSRRFGEGVVNGALTARLGIAAMEAARPMPFRALARPSVSGVVSRAMAGMLWRGREDDAV